VVKTLTLLLPPPSLPLLPPLLLMLPLLPPLLLQARD
jgi:hypothetical protein